GAVRGAPSGSHHPVRLRPMRLRARPVALVGGLDTQSSRASRYIKTTKPRNGPHITAHPNDSGNGPLAVMYSEKSTAAVYMMAPRAMPIANIPTSIIFTLLLIVSLYFGSFA